MATFGTQEEHSASSIAGELEGSRMESGDYGGFQEGR